MRLRRSVAVLAATGVFMGAMVVAPAQADARAFDVFNVCKVASWIGITVDGCYTA